MYSSNESEQDLPSSDYPVDMRSYYFRTRGTDSPVCQNDSAYECANCMGQTQNPMYVFIYVAFSSYVLGYLVLFSILYFWVSKRRRQRMSK